MLAPIALVLTASFASAGQTTAGQPFCLEKEYLQEFVLAMLRKDMTWMKALKEKGCGAMEPGLKIETIEDLPSGSSIGHVARVRVFSKVGSLAGYTLIIEK